MLYCIKRLNQRFLNSILFSVLLLFAATAFADGIGVNKTEARLDEDGYQLTADFAIKLNPAIQQALARGVPIYFVGEFTLTRSRWYWFDEEIFRSEQTTKLSYNELTGRYRISRGSLLQNFSTLEDVLRILQRQNSQPFPPQLIKKEGSYLAAARLRLDINQLPKLLQVNALTGKDWDLNSGWYGWLVRPPTPLSKQPGAEASP